MLRLCEFLVGQLHFEGLVGQFLDSHHDGNSDAAFDQAVGDLIVVAMAVLH